jgi:hypothetical protein
LAKVKGKRGKEWKKRKLKLLKIQLFGNNQKLGSSKKIKLPEKEKRVELSISSKAQKVNAGINGLF